MELLLNLIWISLAPLAVFGFLRGRSVSGQLARVPYRKALIALVCVVVLLFPVISASDDLHPTQAVVEESSKKLKRAVALVHDLQTSPPSSLLPTMLALYLLFGLVLLRPWRPLVTEKLALDGVIVPSAGRAPPPSL